MATRFCRKDAVMLTAMVVSEVSNVGVKTLFKAASSKGMNSFVFLAYSYAIGALLLLPSPFFSHRSRSLPPLSCSILCKMGLLGLLASMYLISGYTGLVFSSPTLASAMSNLTPALTFVLAVIFGLEKVYVKKKSSVAKMVGTLVSISGALVATLYHGPPLFVVSQPSDSLHRTFFMSQLSQSGSTWIIGGALLALEYTLVSLSYIFQAHIMNEYPSELILTLSHDVLVSISCVFIGTLIERNNPSVWIVTSDITLISIFAAGILNSGQYIVLSWVVWHKGPVFSAMFKPLSILIAATMGAIFLGDSFYLGSLIGGTLISIGFYTVLWGKLKEENFDVEMDTPHSSTSEKIPLLTGPKDEHI